MRMHLVLHATYKAGLFLAAGSVLHSMGDQQDFRRFGFKKIQKEVKRMKSC